MKRFLSKIGVVSLMVVFAIISLSFLTQAEKKKITISGKRPLGYISETNTYPGDVSGHQLSQTVYSYDITSSDPDFNGIKTRNQSQVDSIAGKGTFKEYLVYFHKSGDESYVKYEGTFTTNAKEGGAWETPYEGKSEFTGGTGKFKNIKGSGTFKGKVTPEGSAWDWEGEVEY
jgi:hypothetical protein